MNCWAGLSHATCWATQRRLRLIGEPGHERRDPPDRLTRPWPEPPLRRSHRLRWLRRPVAMMPQRPMRR